MSIFHRRDAAAFEALAAQHERAIYLLCLRMMGNPNDAQDCAQEAFLNAYRAFGGFRGQASGKTWLYRIAYNACLDALRKRRNDSSLEALRETGFDPADPSPGTEEQVIAKDERRRLREAIALLPDDQREALILTQLEKVPYEEVAQALGVSEGTVKSRVNRAKARLKEILSEQRELSPPGNVKKDERRSRS